MPVPIPVDFVMGALPLGFKGNLQEYANAIADAMSATIDATFLTGQVGGTMPTSDIGPWAINGEWWFWDPVSGQYQPSDQGTPVGTIVLWGGTGAPTNWLICDGSSVNRQQYSRLFQAIGVTWGSPDNQSFNLPPQGRVPLGAPSYIVTDAYNGAQGAPIPIGPGTLGGFGAETLSGLTMPAEQYWVYFQNFNCAAGTDHTVSAIQSTGNPGVTSGVVNPVVDLNNKPLGQNQEQVNTMPPFFAVNFIIKYQ